VFPARPRHDNQGTLPLKASFKANLTASSGSLDRPGGLRAPGRPGEVHNPAPGSEQWAGQIPRLGGSAKGPGQAHVEDPAHRCGGPGMKGDVSQIEEVDGQLQERRSDPSGLDKGHGDVGEDDGDRDAGKSRTGSQVSHLSLGSPQAVECPERIQHVALHEHVAIPLGYRPDPDRAIQQQLLVPAELPLLDLGKVLQRRLKVEFHVKHLPSGPGGPPIPDYALGRMTTRRFGSSPSLSVSSPPTRATVSCTTLRSYEVIGSRASGLPLYLTLRATSWARWAICDRRRFR
jgi:hypothetical protein